MKKLVLNLLVGITLGNACFAQVVPPVKSQPIKRTIKNTVVVKPPAKSTVVVTPASTNPVVVTPPSTKKETTIKLEDITEWLCPQTLVRGDREFDGHGPRVKCNVTLGLQNNGTEIWAKIYFEAKETVPDWSTTTATWNVKVYSTPYGKKIQKISSDVFSRTDFISPPAGAQFLIPGSDLKKGMDVFFDGQVISSAVLAAHGLPFDATPAIAAGLVKTYLSGNTVIRTPALEGRAVKYFHIVGDTGGDDISNDDNCNDDTRIEKIEFFPVEVVMVNVG